MVEAPGLTWATGIARVPKIVSTFSLWESSKAAATYAYGNRQPAHADAIAEGEAKPFHHQQAFIRFRPYAAQGHLDGKNPLAADAARVAEVALSSAIALAAGRAGSRRGRRGR